MSIKPPPIPLATPQFETLPKDTRIHRVHLTTYAGNAFNPCRGGQTRFAPIADRHGRCVPSLYAGSTLTSAIFETIFHDVPATTALKTVPSQTIDSRSHCVLEPKTALTLVSLRAPGLKNWGVRREQLIGASPGRYGQTARWAEAIHHTFADAQGLVWTSNQCDPDTAYLFFGDRVTAADFNIRQQRDGRTDTGFRADVRRAGEIASIFITL